jgi:hypothetical protein
VDSVCSVGGILKKVQSNDHEWRGFGGDCSSIDLTLNPKERIVFENPKRISVPANLFIA